MQGDFYRLLDSEEPAPRRSFCLDKDEQLPRSFSIAARGGQPQVPFFSCFADKRKLKSAAIDESYSIQRGIHLPSFTLLQA